MYPNCVICSSVFSDEVNNLLSLADGRRDAYTRVENFLVDIMDAGDRALKRYETKRQNESLTDADIAEKSRNGAMIEAAEALLDAGLDGLMEHNRDHRCFGDDWRFRHPILADDDVLENVNLFQAIPTEIGAGVSGLVLHGCMVANCVLPPDATMDEHTRQSHRMVSHCSHLHPYWAEREYMGACEPKCVHMVSSISEIVVDGTTVLRDVRRYQDKQL